MKAISGCIDTPIAVSVVTVDPMRMNVQLSVVASGHEVSKLLSNS